jgi:ribosomal protein S18 acetylase RimI-like enzyme
MTTGFTIRMGLPPGTRSEAVRLYWTAFGPKLDRVLGPEARALAFLDRAMQGDHCLAAVGADGRLLGVAGFRTDRGTFAGGSPEDLRAVYGWTGGLWRARLLGMLGETDADEQFILDGLCVAPDARGHGIGRALIVAICAEAARRGHQSVRLDVVDTNLRARALYERLGFRAVRTARIGMLRHVFRFSAATTMVRAA